MVCEMREETLIDLVAGELTEDEAVRVEQHLAECAPCRTEMNALALMTHPFVSEESWQPDAAMADRVLARAEAGGWGPSPALPSASSARSWLLVPFSWIRRPLPSYATVGFALLALAVGLFLGGGTGRIAGRGVPTQARAPIEPSTPPSPLGERSTGRVTERLTARPAEGDSSWWALSRESQGRAATGARVHRPIAFVAVYTDAMRLTTPGLRDSF
jgi:anti-sigma factor RsiW